MYTIVDFRFSSSAQELVLSLLPGEYQISRGTRSCSCNYYSWINNPVFEAENAEFGEVCKSRRTKSSTKFSKSKFTNLAGFGVFSLEDRIDPGVIIAGP